jgi:hypothetical protein
MNEAPELIEVRKANKNGLFMLYKDGEEIGCFDVEDVEAIDDDTLDSLATYASQESMNRQFGHDGRVL